MPRNQGGIAPAGSTAGSDTNPLPRLDEIGKYGAVGITHEGSKWNRENQIVAGSPVPQLTLTMGTRGRFPVRFAGITQEGGDRRVGFGKHRSAAAAGAANRFPPRLAALPLERGNARASRATLHVDRYPVYE